MPPSDTAELSTLVALLDELAMRCAAVGDRYRDSPDSLVSAEIDNAERQLLAAGRALRRAAGILTD